MDIFGNIFIRLNHQNLLNLILLNICQFPSDWSTGSDNSAVRDNAVDGGIKTLLLKIEELD